MANDTLTIDNNNKCNFVRGYKKNISITITLPSVKKVINNGVGTIRFADSFLQDTLMVKAESSGDIYVAGSYKSLTAISSGNGDLHLRGTTNYLNAFTMGTNYIRADELIVKDYAFVETLSLGDSYINASQLQKFHYNIHKSGRIFYKGTPVEISNLSEDTSKKATKIN